MPDPVLLRFLSEYQGDLATIAFQHDDMFMAQQASIVVASQSENARGTVGAGTSGGFPAALDEHGDVGLDDAEAGRAVEFDFKGAQRLVEPTAVVTGDLDQTTFLAPGWAANAYLGAVARVVAGKGLGQARVVTSNSADTLYFDEPWKIAPDSTSMVEVVIVDPGIDETVFAVATSGRPMAERRGFLVRLDSQGRPFIDIANPLIAVYGKGIPLPPHLRIIGATVSRPVNPNPGVFRRDGDGPFFDDTISVEFTGYHNRMRAAFPSVYTLGNELYLCGDADSWIAGLTIDLRYVPIPPAFTALRDYVFVPNGDRPLREAGALFCAKRLKGLVPNLDAADFIDARSQAEELFLSSIRARDTGYTFVTRDVSPY